MYSVGEEFEYQLEDGLEYYTCISIINYKNIEYLICENEYGVKKVFYYDISEENIFPIDEDDEDTILDVYENELYSDDKEDYEYWEQDFDEYAEHEREDDIDTGFIHNEEEILEEFEDDDFIIEDEEDDLDDFLEDLFEDDDYEK